VLTVEEESCQEGYHQGTGCHFGVTAKEVLLNGKRVFNERQEWNKAIEEGMLSKGFNGEINSSEERNSLKYAWMKYHHPSACYFI
jgi:hypothetical protein